jgi:transcriptional regulator with XRE-family HTH domain
MIWVVKADRDVGRRVKSLRLQRGLSQRDLAAGGVSYAHISRIEGGTRTPSLSALIELADRLDTSALYLATGRTRGRCPVCGRT